MKKYFFVSPCHKKRQITSTIVQYLKKKKDEGENFIASVCSVFNSLHLFIVWFTRPLPSKASVWSLHFDIILL